MEPLKQPWAVSTEGVLLALDSKMDGLLPEDIKVRQKKYGKNVFSDKQKKGIFTIFAKQFTSPLIFLLIGAGVLTSILGEWIDTGVIAFAVLLNVGLGFYHEYGAENTLSKLATYIKDRTRVTRGGKEEEIDSSLLVPGDIIKLSYGTRVPADARILQCNDFRVDEAILTGESVPVLKTNDKIPMSALVAERKNIAHAGTLVVEGYASAVVVATGHNSEVGKIAGIVSGINRSATPLQKGVSSLSWYIFFLVLLVVLGIFLLGISQGNDLLPMLILASAVAVGAVPEAMPIVLTMILAIGAKKIADKKGIIRKLSAAETLGSTTMILTDKTGTLTEANMKLVGIHTIDDMLAGVALDKGKERLSQEDHRLMDFALINVDVSVENPEAEKVEDYVFHGRPFEVNIVRAAREHGVSLREVLSKSKSITLPFNSTIKFSAAESENKYVAMGAPDILLEKSKIPDEKREALESWISEASEAGSRLIGLASFSKKKKAFDVDDLEGGEFLGVFAFYDPIRPEVPGAIKRIESYGMKISLVTGDLLGTALSVMRSIGFDVDKSDALTGADVRAMSDEELESAVSRTKVFARVTPEDKLRIGQAYQRLGEVVAMTGDGVNDAPALKAMDMGISLGSATDVAKASADLVLLDDNFNTISLAIEEGRKILSNIRKGFVYLISNSLDEVFVIGGAMIFGLPLPLTALQIIWVNLFTDSLPALSFAYEENIDKGTHLGKSKKLIFTKEFNFFTLGVGVLSSIFLFLLYFILIKSGIEEGLARSIFFLCFGSYVLAVAYPFRSLHQSIFSFDIFSNKRLNFSVLIGALLMLFTMISPFMRNIFDIEKLPAIWLILVFLWIVFNIFLIEGAKLFLRSHKKWFSKKKA